MVLIFAPIFSFSATLPSGYTELEYIESSGTQYIDTGYYTNADTWVRADVMSLESGNKNWWGGSLTNAFCFNIQTDWSEGSAFEYRYGNLWWNRILQNDIPNNMFSIDFGKNKKIYVNNEVKADLSGVSKKIDSAPLWIFGRNGGTAKIKGRLYSFKIYENDDLVMDLIPVKNINEVVGMYDTVNDVFYTNSGTGTFIAGPAVLPCGYTRLEYIESSGAQYINTGVYAQTGSIVEVDYQITSDRPSGSYDWQAIYGTARGNPAWPGYIFSTLITIRGKKYSLYYNGITDLYDSNIDTARHIIRQESEKFYLDGNLLYTRPTAIYTNSAPVWLFSRAGEDLYMMGRIYSAKIWSDGTNLSFNGIPAKYGDVIGLYDTVSGQFFTNKGSGTFTAGPEMATETSCPATISIQWDGLSEPDASGMCVYGETFTAPSTAPTAPSGLKFLGWIPR